MIWNTLRGLWNEFHFLDQMEALLINHCCSWRLIKETGLIKNLEHRSHRRFIDPEVWPQGLQDVPPVNCHLGRLTPGLLARREGRVQPCLGSKVDSRKHISPRVLHLPWKTATDVVLDITFCSFSRFRTENFILKPTTMKQLWDTLEAR